MAAGEFSRLDYSVIRDRDVIVSFITESMFSLAVCCCQPETAVVILAPVRTEPRASTAAIPLPASVVTDSMGQPVHTTLTTAIHFHGRLTNRIFMAINTGNKIDLTDKKFQ